MHRSAVPPPVARIPAWLGFHAIALTAAWCSPNLAWGYSLWRFHIISLLSLPPLASCWPSKLHFKPQTSCLCESNFLTMPLPILMSLLRIFLSLDPELTIDPFQEIALTLAKWPPSVLTSLQWLVSQIYVSPELVPIARCYPLLLQPTLVIWSSAGTSHNFLT